MKPWTLASSLLLGTCLVIGTAGAQQAQEDPAAAEELQPGDAMTQEGVAAGAEQPMEPGAMAAEAPMGLDSEAIRDIQQALSEAGHDVEVDGIWGPETQSALQEFQQEQGIEATGEPDEQTLAMLGVDTTMQPGMGEPPMQEGADPLQEPGDAELGIEEEPETTQQ